MKLLNTLSAAAFAVLLSTSATAAPLLFELTGSREATFTIDSDRTPDLANSFVFGDQIAFNDVAGTFGGSPGVASTIGFGTVVFATLDINGTVLGFTQFAGPALFSGPVTNPTFNTGTFELTSIVSGSSTLRISEVAGVVPEPAAWAMMITGMGATGFAMRRRTRTSARVRFA